MMFSPTIELHSFIACHFHNSFHFNYTGSPWLLKLLISFLIPNNVTRIEQLMNEEMEIDLTLSTRQCK